MTFNLFVAYDLMAPGQNYDAVRDAIKSLGQYHQFQMSLFYVNTQYTAAQAFELVGRHIDTGDKLCVINAHEGIVTNWDHPPIDAINAIWATG